MQLEAKKSLIIYLSYFFTFCIGLENGIILPTVLEYLRILGSNHEAIILGVAIAGYGLASILSARLMQHLFNATYGVRILLTMCSGAYVIGGFFYCYGISWWGVVLGRWCCGLGSASLAVISADVHSSCMGPELSQLQWYLRFSVALGWMLAPIFSIILASIPFHSQSMLVYSIPGLVCAIVFILCGIFAIAGWCDLGKTLRFCRLRQSLILAYERCSMSSRKSYGAVAPAPFDDPVSDGEYGGQARICGLWATSSTRSEYSSLYSSAKSSFETPQNPPAPEFRKQSMLSQSDEMLENAEDFMGEARPPLRSTHEQWRKSVHSSPGDTSMLGPSEPGDFVIPRFNICNRKGFCITSIEKINWLGPHFLTAFLFGSLQTMLTPLTARYFTFGATENGVLQLVLAILGLAPKLILHRFGLPQKPIVLVGCITAAFSLSWLLLLCPAFETGLSSLPSFCAGMLGVCVACGLLFASCSQRTERLPIQAPRTQRQVASSLGLLLGPLWAGFMVAKPRALLGGQLALIIIAAVVNAF